VRAGPAAAIAELQKALSFDFYGDLHFMLYRAYHDLGKTELARAALNRSAEMRKNSVARDRDKLERWMKTKRFWSHWRPGKARSTRCRGAPAACMAGNFLQIGLQMPHTNNLSS